MEAEYRALKSDWNEGRRERESALHLLFLAWMHWADPPFVTGLSGDPDAHSVWHAVFAYFGGETSQDAEFLYVASIMADLFPFYLGREKEWLARAERMKARSVQLKPEGFEAEFFDPRGEYGEYFAHMTRAAKPTLS